MRQSRCGVDFLGERCCPVNQEPTLAALRQQPLRMQLILAHGANNAAIKFRALPDAVQSALVRCRADADRWPLLKPRLHS